jgi:hypothetical protein
MGVVRRSVPAVVREEIRERPRGALFSTMAGAPETYIKTGGRTAPRSHRPPLKSRSNHLARERDPSNLWNNLRGLSEACRASGSAGTPL